MTKFFNKFKKTEFLVHFPPFWAINLALLGTTSFGFPTPCQNLERSNDTIPKKRQH